MEIAKFFTRFWCRRKDEEDDEMRTLRPGYPATEYCDNRVTNTKYTLITFLPMNLFEQFHRPINLYFLLLTALQFIPSVAPVSPFTALTPLTIAFLITAIKGGIDDWYQHKMDVECNSRIYSVINIDTLAIERVKCSDIRVGDLLLLQPMEVVPCDVLVLLSSDENGEVVVSTESLDGETTCKKRYSILGDLYAQRPITSTATVDLMLEEETDIRNAAEFIRDAACIVESEGPKPFLHSFTGSARVQIPHGNEAEEREMVFGISSEHVVLNSSILRNTRFLLGVAVLTGSETRVAMTRKVPSAKWSMIDQRFNQMVIIVFIFQFILVVIYVSLSETMLEKDRLSFWYFGIHDEKISLKEYVLLLPLRFFSLVSPMVPLSFKVMLDTSKAFITFLIKWDDEISDENGKTEVHNSSLMEDLGQVEYIMTDKTGTLTCNALTLKKIVTSTGITFTPGIVREASTLKRSLQYDELLLQCMRVLVYCNSVESMTHITANITQQSSVSKSHLFSSSSSSSQWMSSSPDEVALVEGAALLGVKLLERTRKRAVVVFASNVESVKIVKVLSFTPERRRSSVLIQIDGDERYLLLSKGSDDSILPRCVHNSYDTGKTLHTLSSLSNEGLRILVTAYRYVTSKEAEKWLAYVQRHESITQSSLRALRLSKAYESIEKELICCGITAVEDQLQDNVRSTITQIRSSGVRVWMLTGDKSQTAKQTAIASGLAGPDDRVIALTPEDAESMTMGEHMEYVEQRVNYVLHKHQFEEAERNYRKQSSFYVRSGLREFVREFFHHDKIVSLLLHHPDSCCDSFHQEHHTHGLHDHMVDGEEERLLKRSSSTSLHEDDQGYVILFSGKTMDLIKNSGNTELFLNFKRVMLHASTVICSRMTPEQKCFVVQTVKDSGYVTLSIGDGDNDASMIQCAHIGIGLRGKEGNQATTASDIVISQFRFLSRLLFFHGHTAYQRSAIIVQQSFWKTVSLAWMQLLFNIYTEFSGVSFWDSFSLMMYNFTFTVPVTFFSAMDMPSSVSILLNNPKLYILSQRGRYLNIVTFYGYILRGLLHGTVIFFLALRLLNDNVSGILRSGYPIDRSCDFYVSCFALVTLHSCIILLETHSITLIHWVALLQSVVSLFLFFALFDAVSGDHSFFELLKNISFYLQWILVVAVPFLSLSVYSAIKLFFFPDLLQLQRLVINTTSKLPFLSCLWPFWVEDNPSQFWGSFSLGCLCRRGGRFRRASASVGAVMASADMQTELGVEEETGVSPTTKLIVDDVRDSTVLSEPLMKRAF